MGEFLEFGEHMTKANFDEKLRQTYIGQAHIAGTGPEGKTCRECIFFKLGKEPYFGAKHTKTPLEMKKQKCVRPILNKAKRNIPHHALSCRLFEQNATPPSDKLEPIGGK